MRGIIRDREIVVVDISLLKIVLLILSYGFIGASLKYIDQSFDEAIYDKNVAIALSLICGLLMAVLIALDSSSAIIFISIIFGVAISRKIDNIAFYLGVTVVFLISGAYRYFFSSISIDWASVASLSLAGFLDELGNDLSDKNYFRGFLKFFFKERFLLKLFIFGFVIMGIFHWAYLIAFLSFDLAYALVDRISSKNLLFLRQSRVI